MCTYDDAISAVTTVIEVIGLVQHTKSQNVKAKYRVQLLKNQAETAKKEAAYERQEGVEESRRKKLQSILSMSREASRFAAGNIALSSQTALNAVDDIKLNGELDALNTLKLSEKRAQGYEERANQYYQNAALTSFNAKLNTRNTFFSIGTKFTNYAEHLSKDSKNYIQTKVKGIKNAL